MAAEGMVLGSTHNLCGDDVGESVVGTGWGKDRNKGCGVGVKFCGVRTAVNPLTATECQSAQMSKITNDGLTQCGRMLYSCTHMATVGVKGFIMAVSVCSL